MQPNSDFKELLSLFNQQQVRYLVVGGYAVIYHTEPRYTKDLDVWISVDAGNATRVYRALQQFGAPLLGISVQDFQVPGIGYQMGRPPARIDILMGLKGVGLAGTSRNRFWRRNRACAFTFTLAH